MTTPNINDKLSEVLKLFLLPNYNVVSTTYMDLLLNHLTTGKTDVDQCNLLKKWILEALEIWGTSHIPCQAVTIFTLKLVGIFSRNEIDFDDLDNHDVFINLIKIFKLRENDLAVSVKMAYTSLLIDVITHKLGRKWVINSGVWIDVVKFSHLDHTMYVTRESHKFIYTLLIEESHNTKLCKEIVLAVSEPLINNSNNPQIQDIGEQYLDQNKLVCTTFDLITSIYEKILFRSVKDPIPDLFEELADLSSRAKAFLDAYINTRLFKHIRTLWVLISFYRMKKGIQDDSDIITAEGFESYRSTFCLMQQTLIAKKLVTEVIKGSQLCIIYWKKLTLLRKFRFLHAHSFVHQNLALMITPMGALMNRSLMKHDLAEMFIDKLFDVTCHPVQRIVYAVQDIIINEKLNSEKFCKASIEMVLDILDYMDRSVAVIAFQSMCYVLKNYMPTRQCFGADPIEIQQKPGRTRSFPSKTIFDGDPIVDNPSLLSTLLQGLTVMTEKFQFKWPDCVETICVLRLAQGILNHSGALPSLCVKALHLSKLAIENFMPPNLALLVESDNAMKDLGNILYKRLHDQNWEVRDSVLEVLTSIAEISENKYPLFQDFLLNHKFLQVGVDISMTDGESYVRASALKFVSTSVKINELWNNELSQLNLPEKAIKLYKEESEAIVRRESVTFIKELYVHRKWPNTVIDEMIRTMAEAAVFDLHWEVKINALEYWRNFIQTQLTDQGMLDGCFPHVTFSKEHRKIVSLNEPEIKRRLNKALSYLAKENCLGVLLSALTDESDLEVTKRAADIIDGLKKILLKYKLNVIDPEVTLLPKDCAIIDNPYVKPQIKQPSPEINSPPKNPSRILEEIVDANDANLLASIHQNSMNMNGSTENTQKQVLKQIPKVSRRQFLDEIFEKDIGAYVAERNRWLKDYTVCLDSVLEDLITAYSQNGINSMDCY